MSYDLTMLTSELLSHPSIEQLRQFVVGKLSDAESAAIETHLFQCDACNQLLSSDSLTDSFVDLVREKSPEASIQHSVPTHIDGYDIISELGRGGMGVVYKAFDQRLKRLVALKVILNGNLAHTEQHERLRREAETIATLQHPGIVQIYQIGEYQGHVYLALELLDAKGLQQVMDTAPQCPRWSAALIAQLAEIIHYSHQRGIIHRDLKPENILFNQALDQGLPRISQFNALKNSLPVVKITDFGLAKYLETHHKMTKTGLMLGTPHYMSPEQIPDSGDVVGYASDIYALGVILYQLLTGRVPFASNNLLEVLKMLRHDDPIAPRQLNPEIPRDLETICLKCLMKKPVDRYASAQDLADDLTLFLQNEPIRAKPLSLWQCAMKWARQKPFLASCYSVLLGMYGLHLFAMSVLQLPRHQGVFHTILTASTIGLAVFFYGLQKILASEKWQRLGVYACMGVTVVAVTLIFICDAAALSAPINIYMYLIMGAALIAPSAHIIWLQTLLSLLGYICLLLFAHWFNPVLQVSVEVAVFFMLNIVITGFLTYLMVRRVNSINKM